MDPPDVVANAFQAFYFMTLPHLGRHWGVKEWIGVIIRAGFEKLQVETDPVAISVNFQGQTGDSGCGGACHQGV
eukprot:scaffold68204_cov23-Cyclotella_meneghiniana.AAC.7